MTGKSTLALGESTYKETVSESLLKVTHTHVPLETPSICVCAVSHRISPSARDEWIKCVYLHTMEFSPGLERNEITSFPRQQVELEIVILSKMIQTQKDKCYISSPICGT